MSAPPGRRQSFGTDLQMGAGKFFRFRGGQRHPEMLQFIHHLARLTAHELNRVLVAEIIGTLHRIIHMPVPIILSNVPERCRDASLRRYGMRAGGKYF